VVVMPALVVMPVWRGVTLGVALMGERHETWVGRVLGGVESVLGGGRLAPLVFRTRGG
jgi:hypothetical protein